MHTEAVFQQTAEGEWSYLQVVRQFEGRKRFVNPFLCTEFIERDVLDGSFPNETSSDDVWVGDSRRRRRFVDSPSMVLGSPWFREGATDYAQQASLALAFDVWLMFKPSGGIWVPTHKFSWSSTGQRIQFSGGVRTVTDDGDERIPLSVSRADGFPVWTKGIKETAERAVMCE